MAPASSTSRRRPSSPKPVGAAAAVAAAVGAPPDVTGAADVADVADEADVADVAAQAPWSPSLLASAHVFIFVCVSVVVVYAAVSALSSCMCSESSCRCPSEVVRVVGEHSCACEVAAVRLHNTASMRSAPICMVPRRLSQESHGTLWPSDSACHCFSSRLTRTTSGSHQPQPTNAVRPLAFSIAHSSAHNPPHAFELLLCHVVALGTVTASPKKSGGHHRAALLDGATGDPDPLRHVHQTYHPTRGVCSHTRTEQTAQGLRARPAETRLAASHRLHSPSAA